MSTIGFVGLGNMGFPMASRLAEAGHRLIVEDRDQGAVQRFQDQHPGSRTAIDVKAWQDADIIITMLPSSDIVEAVLSGGVAAAASLNTLFIDMSSSEPIRSRNLGQRLEQQGMRYLDAPVSGGVRGAQNGQLAIMVGGNWQDLDQAKDIFDVLGKSVIHVGKAGSGHAAKALNNLVSAASVAATVEALRVGERFGIDPATMTEVLNASSGRSNTSENKVAQFMLSGTFGSGFPIGLMTKDIKIATALADSLGVEAPFSHDCETIWQSVLDAGHGADDHTRMYEHLATPTPAFNDERQIHA
ncbi:2-hydroxy-3-oxopropionate reductase [Arthrobacter globiformis NBRC 12137]|uniref:2-hydroxy-3-oxopropionate reductase n=1 Tax=Arthrobacter globiformis (strain ATCC 8010 / DSM 20124 / JCM 1332 / NBRC 12137 / NCIMB 8907 / NRRL B-2979 / 168) TaxID=1077972 RepID=H0QLT7_ARTG1|nr:NAD(P)-dependent oxidoreductase [Arthrobacter globiformis]GAB13788.1 2-hydroxy-3-oxopropionate reductase [Arthrobacter globiformis NBRC 12137]